jgi:hypothetical protein
LPSPRSRGASQRQEKTQARGGGTGGRRVWTRSCIDKVAKDSSPTGGLMNDVVAESKATQKAQFAQHCLSSFDFGVSRLQSLAGASTFVFAQQLAFVCGLAAWAGIAARASEKGIARQTTNRSGIRMGKILRLRSCLFNVSFMRPDFRRRNLYDFFNTPQVGIFLPM